MASIVIELWVFVFNVISLVYFLFSWGQPLHTINIISAKTLGIGTEVISYVYKVILDQLLKLYRIIMCLNLVSSLI